MAIRQAAAMQRVALQTLQTLAEQQHRALLALMGMGDQEPAPGAHPGDIWNDSNNYLGRVRQIEEQTWVAVSAPTMQAGVFADRAAAEQFLRTGE